MKIKKLLPQQTEEIEITLPAYFTKHNAYFYKINSDETISHIHVMPHNMLILPQYSGEPIEKIVTFPHATEQEWVGALKKLADHFGQFMCNNGLTEQGYRLPEPKDFEPQEEINEK